ncbi:MAG: glycosyltransferase family 9 protein [Flavobacteriaceae bacterium]|nr:glycosyltransferase family 9 protein [Flavobacteriaceae bacterium]
MPSNPRKILVIRLSSLGDVAIAEPVLRELTTKYTQDQFFILTKPHFVPIFQNLNVQVINFEAEGRHNGILGLYKLASEIRKLNIDAVADLHNVLRTMILRVFLFDLPFIKLDKGRMEKKALTSGLKFEQLKPTYERYADVFRKLDYEINLQHPQFPQRANLSPEINKFIGVDSKKWIGFAPFAAHKGKMYPIELTKEVIQTLSENHKVVLFGGGREETKKLKEIANRFNNTISVAGEFSFAQELDIISNLDLMVSMDSGNAHLAAMKGIPVVSIWGVTHPYAGFYPFNQKEENALLADREQFPQIPTSVYGDKCPKDYEEAIRSISPSQIVEKVKKVLASY